MRSRFSPLHLMLFLLALGFLFFYVQLAVAVVVAEKLGLRPQAVLMLFAATLFGSGINLPLFSMRAEPPSQEPQTWSFGLIRLRPMPYTGRTLVAINVGGCVIPVLFSFYLLNHIPIGVVPLLIALGTVTGVSYWMSRLIPGVGIGMPMFIGPVAAAIIALLVGGDHAAPLAYVSGTLGVLIGADLLHLSDIRKMGMPFGAIGGAGTFDGIFITGILAVLLA